MKKGILIAIDGPNGVGKITLIGLLKEKLKDLNYHFFHTKEVTDSNIGKVIIDNVDRFNSNTLACLIAADRYNNIENVILPKLKSNTIVITERYLPSSLVYQIIDGCDQEYICLINKHILIPNVTYILQSNEETLQNRLERRETKDRYEHNKNFRIQEVKLYEQGINLLRTKGWRIEPLNNSDGNLEKNVTKIMDDIKYLLNN